MLVSLSLPVLIYQCVPVNQTEQSKSFAPHYSKSSLSTVTFDGNHPPFSPTRLQCWRMNNAVKISGKGLLYQMPSSPFQTRRTVSFVLSLKNPASAKLRSNFKTSQTDKILSFAAFGYIIGLFHPQGRLKNGLENHEKKWAEWPWGIETLLNI